MSESAKKIKNHPGRFKEGHRVREGMKNSEKQKLAVKKAMPWKKVKPFSKERRKKYSEMFLGNKNSNWKGGITPENKKQRSSRLSIMLRKAAFKRDNYTCKKCSDRGVILNAHHKNSFAKFKKLRFDLDNLATLCENCHKKFHKEFGRINNNEEQFNKFLS